VIATQTSATSWVTSLKRRLGEAGELRPFRPARKLKWSEFAELSVLLALLEAVVSALLTSP
jgi:hypothetical protein